MRYYSMGPVAMFPSTLEVAGRQVPYFRTPEFSKLMLETDSLFKRLLATEDDTRIMYLTASGTAAMEATLFNCFDSHDKLLVVDGGIFGHRFVQICEKFGIPFDSVSLAFGEELTAEKLDRHADEAYTAFVVNIHETSTGQLYDIDLISRFCQERGLYLVVDAISSFLADPYEMDRWRIDATILSSQKGLALGPGMSFVALSPRLFEEKVMKVDPPSLYFDFKEYAVNFERGQTPYTPAVRVAYELNDMLRHLAEEGMGERLASVASVAGDFRERLAMVEGVDMPRYPLSNAMTPILFNERNASQVYEYLKVERGICLTPCGGDLKDVMTRVAHIGNHVLCENDMLVRELSRALAWTKGARSS